MNKITLTIVAFTLFIPNTFADIAFEVIKEITIHPSEKIAFLADLDKTPFESRPEGKAPQLCYLQVPTASPVKRVISPGKRFVLTHTQVGMDVILLQDRLAILNNQYKSLLGDNRLVDFTPFTSVEVALEHIQSLHGKVDEGILKVAYLNTLFITEASEFRRGLYIRCLNAKSDTYSRDYIIKGLVNSSYLVPSQEF